MTELLLAAILAVLLLQIHAKEKNAGRYGMVYVFFKKRILRRSIKYFRKKVGEWQNTVRRFIRGIQKKEVRNE